VDAGDRDKHAALFRLKKHQASTNCNNIRPRMHNRGDATNAPQQLHFSRCSRPGAAVRDFCEEVKVWCGVHFEH
jgi:hypothetical protein